MLLSRHTERSLLSEAPACSSRRVITIQSDEMLLGCVLSWNRPGCTQECGTLSLVTRRSCGAMLLDTVRTRHDDVTLRIQRERGVLRIKCPSQIIIFMSTTKPLQGLLKYNA